MTPALPEEIEPKRALRAQARARFPTAVLTVVALLGAALPIELFYFPERGNLYLLIYGVELGVSSIALSLARAWPDRIHSVITAWVATMAGLIVLYYPLVGGDATVALAALACVGAATPVLIPISLRHHVVTATAAGLGLLVLWALGVGSSLPWPYVFLTFVAVSVLAGVGVFWLDEARGEAVKREAALRRVEGDLREALTRAELAVEQRSRLIADVSHEVRTPVNVILGYADMLLDDSTTPEERAELVARIRDYGLSIDALVTQLLDLSRLQTGRFDVNYEPVGLEALLEEMGGSARLMVREKPIDIEIAWHGDRIVTDGLRIRQILSNLITNAARATDSGVISIRAQCHDDRCRFTVADTGRGIPKERQEQIFAPFAQVQPGAGGGIGLGLAIVRQLAEILGGEVTVHSAPGRGAAFSVDLPIAPAVSEVESAEEEPAAEAAAEELRPSRGAKVVAI